jgi:hypothetical protein
MPWVGFEDTVPASEEAKTVHALGRSANMTGNIKVITSTDWEAVVLVLLMRWIYDVRHWDGIIWHDIYVHTKFPEDWDRRSNIIKILSQKFEMLQY